MSIKLVNTFSSERKFKCIHCTVQQKNQNAWDIRTFLWWVRVAESENVLIFFIGVLLFKILNVNTFQLFHFSEHTRIALSTRRFVYVRGDNSTEERGFFTFSTFGQNTSGRGEKNDGCRLKTRTCIDFNSLSCTYIK